MPCTEEYISEFIKTALNDDLRNAGGEKCIPDDLHKAKLTEIQGPLLLQVQKVTNVAIPKMKDETGENQGQRLLKILLTDGHSECNAVEIKRLQKLSKSTPPGTKIKLTGTLKVRGRILLIEDSNIHVLGGNVEKLVSKWQLNQTLSDHSRPYAGREGGPPVFVPFGQEMPKLFETPSATQTKNEAAAQLEDESGSEFSEQRKAAIDELHRSKTHRRARDNFGGALAANNLSQIYLSQGSVRNKQDHFNTNRYNNSSSISSTADTDVQVDLKSLTELVEMGFKRDEALDALKRNDGDLIGAIDRLTCSVAPPTGGGRRQPAAVPAAPQSSHRDSTSSGRGRGRGRGRGGRRQRDDDDDYDDGDVTVRPPSQASLFDFLKPKLNDKLMEIDDFSSSGVAEKSGSRRNDNSRRGDRYQEQRFHGGGKQQPGQDERWEAVTYDGTPAQSSADAGKFPDKLYSGIDEVSKYNDRAMVTSDRGNSRGRSRGNRRGGSSNYSNRGGERNYDNRDGGMNYGNNSRGASNYGNKDGTSNYSNRGRERDYDNSSRGNSYYGNKDGASNYSNRGRKNDDRDGGSNYGNRGRGSNYDNRGGSSNYENRGGSNYDNRGGSSNYDNRGGSSNYDNRSVERTQTHTTRDVSSSDSSRGYDRNQGNTNNYLSGGGNYDNRPDSVRRSDIPETKQNEDPTDSTNNRSQQLEADSSQNQNHDNRRYVDQSPQAVYTQPAAAPPQLVTGTYYQQPYLYGYGYPTDLGGFYNQQFYAASGGNRQQDVNTMYNSYSGSTYNMVFHRGGNRHNDRQ